MPNQGGYSAKHCLHVKDICTNIQPDRHMITDRFADNEPSSEQQPSTSGQSGGRSASFSSLADSFGSQKAFVSEDEWRVMDKKVGAAGIC